MKMWLKASKSIDTSVLLFRETLSYLFGLLERRPDWVVWQPKKLYYTLRSRIYTWAWFLVMPSLRLIQTSSLSHVYWCFGIHSTNELLPCSFCRSYDWIVDATCFARYRPLWSWRRRNRFGALIISRVRQDHWSVCSSLAMDFREQRAGSSQYRNSWRKSWSPDLPMRVLALCVFSVLVDWISWDRHTKTYPLPGSKQACFNIVIYLVRSCPIVWIDALPYWTYPSAYLILFLRRYPAQWSMNFLLLTRHISVLLFELLCVFTGFFCDHAWIVWLCKLHSFDVPFVYLANVVCWRIVVFRYRCFKTLNHSRNFRQNSPQIPFRLTACNVCVFLCVLI